MPVSQISELVGRVVGGRYRLVRPVGSGTSAHVFVAEDVRLKRRVAVKLLHAVLAEDHAFLRRFQTEARVVAALRHPGIVRVYDWGEDGNEAFLVMELLEGGSLRSLLDTGYRLSVAQAAALGVDVAAALAYAHSRGLVHRDVKPANLLLDEEGRASVADFGIARALAEASWTEPLGALVGTARYAAPELVQGAALDGRADVYALALVLVEAVTGEVPFSLDTALGALFARATTPLPVPDDLGPLVPVLARAGAVEPSQRTSAAALAEDLAAVATTLRAPCRLPAPGLAVDLQSPPVGRTDLSVQPGAGGALGLTILADDLGRAPVGAVEVEPRPGPREGTVRPGPGAGIPAPKPGPSAAPAVAPPGRPRRQRRRWAWRGAVFALVVALGAAGLEATAYLGRPAPTYAVPRLGGDAVARAETLLAAEHLEAAVTARQWSPTVPVGAVLSQYPGPGAREHAKELVYLVISKGPQPVAVPPLGTLDLAQARALLGADGLRLGRVMREPSMTVPAGSIISWSGRGSQLVPRSPVDVVVSAGKPMEAVPVGAVGTPFARLDGELLARRFKVFENRYYSTAVPAGVVISTAPPPGKSEVIGSDVTVDVSLGPHLVVIPPTVVGLSVVQAAKVLYALGVYVYGEHGSLLDNVVATEPPVGTRVPYGSSVVLVTG